MQGAEAEPAILTAVQVVLEVVVQAAAEILVVVL
jgi:hypothetical protein